MTTAQNEKGFFGETELSQKAIMPPFLSELLSPSPPSPTKKERDDSPIADWLCSLLGVEPTHVKEMDAPRQGEKLSTFLTRRLKEANEQAAERRLLASQLARTKRHHLVYGYQ